MEDVMPPQSHPFDLLHGVETSGFIPGESIPAISLSALYSTAYTGISPSALTQALSELPIRCGDFTFVDLGCGKGRALMVAAQFPFRHLLGVELASELCNVARANVATDPGWVSRMSIVNEDATKVAYPDGPLLIYMFNPFLAHALRRVLENLERQLRRCPRDVYILYADNPRFADVMQSFSFLREISHTAYALSQEDTVFDRNHREQEYFTLYSANIGY
jgi:SAM-dependent methyltransferase